MKRTGLANLPLHNGKAPAWLFKRMTKLGYEITKIIVDEYGAKEFLSRMSNPYFFQSLGCVLGFDWHSSGLTTTLTGALKFSINKKAEELGLFIAGGKGKTSLKTKEDILKFSDEFNIRNSKINSLINASITTAKVDNSLIQDNYSLYHHVVIVDEKGNWTIVQQGLNKNNNYARRYHWLSFETKSFIDEPHSKENGIIGFKEKKLILNLTSKKSEETRKTSLDLAKDYKSTIRLIESNRQESLLRFIDPNFKELNMPRNHFIKDMNFRNLKGLKDVMKKAYELQPSNYEELIKIRGFGPKTLRSLALISKIIYGTEIDWHDPTEYSFAHGGKDGIPYPVNKRLMDKNIEFLKSIIEETNIENNQKLKMVRRLKDYA